MKFVLVIVLALFVAGTFAAKAETEGAVACGACELAVKAVEAYVNKNTTQSQILSTLKKACNIAGPFKKQCNDIIDTQGPGIIKMLLKHAAAQDICAKLDLCSADVEAALTGFYVVNFEETEATMGGTCPLCEYTVKVAESYINATSTRAEILGFLKGVCAISGPYAQQCEEVVQEKGDAIISFLLKKENPEVLCQQLTLCPKSNFVVEPMAGGLCPECEFIIQMAEGYISKNNYDSVLKFIEHACALAPSPYGDECKAVVESEGPKLLGELLKKETPEKVCEQIKICPVPKSPAPKPPVAFVETEAMAVSACEICDLVAKTAEDYVRNGLNTKHIIDFLDNACDALQSPYKFLCKGAVDSEAPKLLNQLAEKRIPELCASLHFCPAA